MTTRNDVFTKLLVKGAECPGDKILSKGLGRGLGLGGGRGPIGVPGVKGTKGTPGMSRREAEEKEAQWYRSLIR